MDPRTETARAWKTTKVSQYVQENLKSGSILDFGCGKFCAQLLPLRDAGRDADGYDIWFEDHEPPEGGIYSRQRLPFRRYDIVMLSNLINIQRTPEELRETLLEAQAFVNPGGCLVMNYPKDPRRLDWTSDTMRDFVEKVLGVKLDPVDSDLWVGRA